MSLDFFLHKVYAHSSSTQSVWPTVLSGRPTDRAGQGWCIACVSPAAYEGHSSQPRYVYAMSECHPQWQSCWWLAVWWFRIRTASAHTRGTPGLRFVEEKAHITWIIDVYFTNWPNHLLMGAALLAGWMVNYVVWENTNWLTVAWRS